MSGFAKRNILLFAALIVVAAGVLVLRSRRAASLPESQPVENHPANSSPHFATMRSSHQPTAEQIEKQRLEQAWLEALSSADRCSAMALNVSSSEMAMRAMEWAKSIYDEGKRKMAVESILCAWTKFDPQGAVNWAMNITNDPSARAFALTSVFESWAAQDAKGASSYIATLGQADQTYGIAAVAPALAANSAQDAIRWAQGFDEDDTRNLATHAVVTAWARNAPADAAAWVATEPDGFDRADDVRAVVQRWLETDANAAVAWVGQLPAGTSRDGALDLIASQLTQGYPSVAALWGEAIDRPELRDARLGVIAGKWLSTDPEAARNWLDKTPLSDQTKTQLTAPGNRSPH